MHLNQYIEFYNPILQSIGQMKHYVFDPRHLPKIAYGITLCVSSCILEIWSMLYRYGSCGNNNVAKVLLVDGSVMRFKVPIKAIQVLVDHPHHFICSLDSLKPGIHPLSILLPHEELSLGKLYLLLPSSKSLQKQAISSRLARSSTQVAMGRNVKKSEMGSIPRRKPEMGSLHCRKPEMGSSHIIKTTEMGASPRIRKTEMGSSPSIKNTRVQLQDPPCPSSAALHRCRTPWVPRLQTIEESTHSIHPSMPSLQIHHQSSWSMIYAQHLHIWPIFKCPINLKLLQILALFNTMMMLIIIYHKLIS